MFNKKFVSIFILPTKLQVLQLSSNKKKVSKHISVDIPSGIIANNQVADKTALAKILKQAWSKLHIREKTVGIVVPEFSTFIKLLTIPVLSLAEVDEAVRHEAQDFLPSSIENMILDWKIVEKQEGSYQILVAAMRKNTLVGYVESVENAGLFPMLIETPSLSLVRIGNDSGSLSKRIIVYGLSDQSIVILARGNRIIGSSIVDLNNQSEIVRTAKRMMSHFNETDLNTISYGGIGINEGLLQIMEKELNVPVERLELKVGGLHDDQAQEYLIPLSLQYKEFGEPSNPNTINLLPDFLVDKYKKAKLRIQVWSLTLAITLLVWLSFFSTLASYIVLSQMISDFEARNLTKTQIATKRGEAVSEVKKINEISDKVDKIQKISVDPQIILNEIYRAKPAVVALNKYELDLEKGLIALEGVSANRTSLIDFKKSLEESEKVGMVNLPLSSFESDENIEFTLEFNYLLESNQKKIKISN